MAQDTVVEIPGVGAVTFPASMSGDEINAAAKRLHDEAAGSAPAAPTRRMNPGEEAVSHLIDFGIGGLKGAGHTVKTLADLGRQHLPGFADLDKLGHVQVGTTLEPSNATQHVGKVTEQMAEWYGPGKIASGLATKAVPKIALMVGARAAPLVAEGVMQGAASVPMAVAHGEDPRVAAATGAVMPAAMRGTGALVKKAADTVVPASLRRLMPELARHSEDFGDLTSFARQQQTAIGDSEIQGALSKAQAQKVDYLLGLRDESRPAVAGLLPPGRTALRLGHIPEPTGGEGAVIPARLPEHGPHPAGTPPPMVEPGFTGEIAPSAGRPDVVAGPGAIRLPVAPSRWKPGQGAPAQMVDAAEIAAGTKAARMKLADSTDAVGDLTKLQRLEDKFLASRQEPMTLGATKRTARMANNRAHNAYLATKQGQPVQEVPSIFNKAIGGQANAIVRERAPEIVKYDDLAQKHLGLSRVLYDAQEAAKLHNPLSAKPTSWITPRMMSKGVYHADNAAGATARMLGSQRGGQQGLLLARLAQILAAQGAGGRTGGGQ